VKALASAKSEERWIDSTWDPLVSVFLVKKAKSGQVLRRRVINQREE
jgi:hypothetical protein